MTYRVEIMPVAIAALERLPKKVSANARAKIDALADEPRPHGVVKIVGHKNIYRLRVGDWRILYEIDDGIRRVLVFLVAHRREVYRGF